MVEKPSSGGGGRDALFNHGVDPQLRIMERLEDMIGEERSENLRIPLASDDREIYLRFLSKGDCIRSCTHSHAPVRGHDRDSVIWYIRVAREFMDPSQKRNFNGGGDQGSHRGHWNRIRVNVPRNSEGQNHRNCAVFGGGQGVHSGGIDGNNGGGGGARGVHGNNANPPMATRTRSEERPGCHSVYGNQDNAGWRSELSERS